MRQRNVARLTFVLFVAAILALGAQCTAGAAAPEMINSSRIFLTRVTDDAKAAIEATDGFRELPVYFHPLATDADLATVRRIPWVKNLILERCRATDISPLTDLAELEVLSIQLRPGDPQWRLDLRPLEKLKRLKRLSIGSLAIADEGPLANLTWLRHLTVRFVDTFSLACVARMPDLESLSVYVCKGCLSLESLRDRAKLRVISLDMLPAPPEEYEVFRTLPGLESVRIQSRTISDLRFLSDCRALTTLTLTFDRALKSLSGIEGLAKLRTLRIDRTGVADLTPLRGCPGLRTLISSDNAVSDLAPLAACGELDYLNLRKTQVADVSPLKGLAKLKLLDLRETQVEDLAPLAEVKTLRTLYLSPAVGEEQVGALRKALPNCRFVIGR